MKVNLNKPRVLVHGSAAQYVTTGTLPEGHSPRDIDVIHAYGDDPEQVTALARAWANQHDLNDLPLDITAEHTGLHHTQLEVPVPWNETNGYAVPLTSDANPSWAPRRGLPALLRSRLPIEEIVRIATRQEWPWRIAVINDRPADNGINDYVDGLVALGNAAAKNPQAWQAVIAAAPWGRELDYLIRHGVSLKVEHVEALYGGNPGMANWQIVITLSQTGMGQQYASWAQGHYKLGIRGAAQALLRKGGRIRPTWDHTRKVVERGPISTALGVPTELAHTATLSLPLQLYMARRSANNVSYRSHSTSVP
ncbi:hypothetical protein ACH4VR_36170 [Streptomyces sp. NPDC020883]|uniref:hypothetical protein n=1 Tax=Streptomyces sp. NPDC020883 TaxID=3365099 RepID=UPI00379EDA3F